MAPPSRNWRGPAPASRATARPPPRSIRGRGAAGYMAAVYGRGDAGDAEQANTARLTYESAAPPGAPSPSSKVPPSLPYPPTPETVTTPVTIGLRPSARRRPARHPRRGRHPPRGYRTPEGGSHPEAQAVELVLGDGIENGKWVGGRRAETAVRVWEHQTCLQVARCARGGPLRGASSASSAPPRRHLLPAAARRGDCRDLFPTGCWTPGDGGAAARAVSLTQGEKRGREGERRARRGEGGLPLQHFGCNALVEVPVPGIVTGDESAGVGWG